MRIDELCFFVLFRHIFVSFLPNIVPNDEIIKEASDFFCSFSAIICRTFGFFFIIDPILPNIVPISPNNVAILSNNVTFLPKNFPYSRYNNFRPFVPIQSIPILEIMR